ncbi:MAG: SDR family oxidoreductase [Deltaproteobacteria bacterium]|nr:SDR family oxidoreductase [Deltaproteobacteria bacterium]
MNILITGGAGMLGHLLANSFKSRHRVIYTTHRDAISIDGAEQIPWDLTREAKVLTGIEAVIHTAAMTNVDLCQQNSEQAHQSNVVGTRNVVNAVPGAHVIYISTDFVFDGAWGNYSEDDPPSPISVYGQTKLGGEKEIPRDGCIIRTSIYGLGSGPQRPGMVEKLIDRMRNGETVSGFTDQTFTPISTGNLALFLEELMERHLTGIYNIGSSQPCTKYEFIRAAALAFGFDPEAVKPGLSSSVNYLAPRPRDVSLDTGKSRRTFKAEAWSLGKSFETIKQEWENRSGGN